MIHFNQTAPGIQTLLLPGCKHIAQAQALLVRRKFTLMLAVSKYIIFSVLFFLQSKQQQAGGLMSIKLHIPIKSTESDISKTYSRC